MVWACIEKTCRFCSKEGSQITRSRGRLRNTIRETIKKDLEINELDRNMACDRT